MLVVVVVAPLRVGVAALALVGSPRWRGSGRYSIVSLNFAALIGRLYTLERAQEAGVSGVVHYEPAEKARAG